MQDIVKLDGEYIAHTYACREVVLVKGKGCYAMDENGRTYLDLTSGIGVNSLGYCDAKWAQAVCEQVQMLQHTSNLYSTAPAALLAKELCTRTGQHKVFFANSGAEANEGAMKTARKYSFTKYGAGRAKILSLTNSFHGRTFGALSATGQEVFHQYFNPFLPDVASVKAGDFEALEAAATPDVCAVMLELIQGEGGVVALDKEYVQKIAALCAKKDILLIVDEVQTGVGRTGKFLCCEHYNLHPDIVTLAKGLGGGLPIGAFLLGGSCADVLQPGDHGSTFGGNPIACTGAFAVVKRLDTAFLESVTQKGNALRDALLELPQIAHVSGLGLMRGAALVAPYDAKLTVKALQKAGVLLLTAKDKLRFLPPLTISLSEIKEGVKALKSTLEEM